MCCWHPTPDQGRHWHICYQWYVAARPPTPSAPGHKICTHWLAAPINLTMMTAGQVKLLKDAEQQGEERAKPKRPRAIVLGPTRELTDQILGVAKSMSHFAKFRSACVNGGQRSHHNARPPLAVLMEAYCTATDAICRISAHARCDFTSQRTLRTL